MEPAPAVEGLRKRGSRNAVENAIQLKEKRCRTHEAKDIRRAQKEAAGHADRGAASTLAKPSAGRGAAAGRRPDPVLEKGEVVDFSSLSSSDRTPLTSPSPSPSPDFSAPGTPASHSATPSLLSEADLMPDAMPPQALFHGESRSLVRSAPASRRVTRRLPSDDEEPEGMIDPGVEYVPPHRGGGARKNLRPAPQHIKREADSEDDEGLDGDLEEPAGRGEGAAPSAGGPERRRIPHPEKADGAQTARFAALGLYEERVLLRRLAACALALDVAPQARRLHRKLLLRHAKRQRGLPLLDVDRAVSATLGLVGGLYGAQGVGALVPGAAVGKYRTTGQELRILDRFQVPVDPPSTWF